MYFGNVNEEGGTLGALFGTRSTRLDDIYICMYLVHVFLLVWRYENTWIKSFL